MAPYFHRNDRGQQARTSSSWVPDHWFTQPSPTSKTCPLSQMLSSASLSSHSPHLLGSPFICTLSWTGAFPINSKTKHSYVQVNFHLEQNSPPLSLTLLSLPSPSLPIAIWTAHFTPYGVISSPCPPSLTCSEGATRITLRRGPYGCEDARANSFFPGLSRLDISRTFNAPLWKLALPPFPGGTQR